MAQYFLEETIGKVKMAEFEETLDIQNGGFELGNFTYYVPVNQTTNYWIIGEDQKSSGSYAAYITADGSTASYNNNTTQISHFYRDFRIKPNYPILKFKARVGGGERNFDYLKVTVSSYFDTPNAGQPFNPNLKYAESGEINLNNNFDEYSLDLSNAVGFVVRVVFSWVNDSFLGTNPPAIIDDIKFSNYKRTLLELEPSEIRIGGKKYNLKSNIYVDLDYNGLGGLDEGDRETSTYYNLFIVYKYRVLSLVASKEEIPLGFENFRLISRFRTDLNGNISEIRYDYLNDNFLETFEFLSLENNLFNTQLDNLFCSNWFTQVISGSSSLWSCIAFGNSTFVALSGNSNTATNKIAYTKDGYVWNFVSAPSSNSWTSIVYADNKFVAVSNTGTSRVMTSPTGLVWTSQVCPTNNWTSICYGNSLFVAVANSGTNNRVMVSENAVNWFSITTPVDNNWSSVCFGGGTFVAVASSGINNNLIMVSLDGASWESIQSPSSNSWSSVAYGNGVFVAVASSGINRIMYSENGYNWVEINSPVNNSWKHITFSEDIKAFVAVSATGSGDRIIYSTNGIDWEIKKTDDYLWNSVCYGNKRFICLEKSSTNLTFTQSLQNI
jgi:hypothetical protein